MVLVVLVVVLLLQFYSVGAMTLAGKLAKLAYGVCQAFKQRRNEHEAFKQGQDHRTRTNLRPASCHRVEGESPALGRTSNLIEAPDRLIDIAPNLPKICSKKSCSAVAIRKDTSINRYKLLGT